jgi:hypothetical protein
VNNNLPKVRFLLSKFQIKNITTIKHIQQDSQTLKMRGNDFETQSNSSSKKEEVNHIQPVNYDTSNWSLVLFAIYY